MRNVGGVYFTGNMLKGALQYIFSIRSFQHVQRVIDAIDPVAFYYSSQVWTVLNRILNENAFVLESLGGIAMVHSSIMKLGCFEGYHEFYCHKYFMDTSKSLMLYFGSDHERYVTKKDFFTGLLQEVVYVDPTMRGELRVAFGYWAQEKIRLLTRFEFAPYNDINVMCDRITDVCGLEPEHFTPENISEFSLDAFNVEDIEEVIPHFQRFFLGDKQEWESFGSQLRASISDIYHNCTDAECQIKCRRNHLFKLHNQLTYLFNIEKYLEPSSQYCIKTIPHTLNEPGFDKSLYKPTLRKIGNAVTGSLFFLDELKWVINQAYNVKYGETLERVLDQRDGGIFHPIVHCPNSEVLCEILANFGLDIEDIVQIVHITDTLCGNREIPIPAPNTKICIHPVRALNEIFEVLLIDCNIFNQLKVDDLNFLEECLQPFFNIFQPDRRILYYLEYGTFYNMKHELVQRIQPKLVYKAPCPKIYVDWELRKKIGIRSYLGDHKVMALLLPHVDQIVDMIHHDFVKRGVTNFEAILYPVEFCIFLSRFPQFAHYLHNSRQCGQYSFCLCKLDFENKFKKTYNNCVPTLNEEVIFAVQIMKYSMEMINTDDLQRMEERAHKQETLLAKKGFDVNLYINPPSTARVVNQSSVDSLIDDRTKKREKNRKKKERKRANKLARIEIRKEYREASVLKQEEVEVVALPKRSIGIQVGSKDKECEGCQNLRIEMKSLTNREKENKVLRKKIKELEEQNDLQEAELKKREDKEDENKELKETVQEVQKMLEEMKENVKNREKVLKEEIENASSKAEKLENRLKREQDVQRQVRSQFEETNTMLQTSVAQTSKMAEEMEQLSLEKERLSKRQKENENRIAVLEKQLSDQIDPKERRKYLDMYNRRLEIVLKGRWKECAYKLAQEYCDIAVNVSAFIRAKEEIDEYGKSMDLYEWCLRKNISIIESNLECPLRSLQPVPDFPIMFSNEVINIIREATTRRELSSNGSHKDDLECMICVKRFIDVSRRCSFCFRRYHAKCLSLLLTEFKSCAVCGREFLENSPKNGISF